MLEAQARKRLVTSTGGASPQPVEKIPQAETGRAREQAAAVSDAVNQVSETGHLPDAVTGADGKSYPATGRGRQDVPRHRARPGGFIT